MSTKSWIRLFVYAACGLLFGGCAYGPRNVVLRSQFAAAHDCQDVTVVRDGVLYTVSGCEKTEKYECPEDEGYVEYSDTSCRLEGERAKAPAGGEQVPPVQGEAPLDSQQGEDLPEDAEDLPEDAEDPPEDAEDPPEDAEASEPDSVDTAEPAPAPDEAEDSTEE